MSLILTPLNLDTCPDTLLYAFASISKFGDSYFMSFAQDFQLGEFSIGFVEQASFVSYSDNGSEDKWLLVKQDLIILE